MCAGSEGMNTAPAFTILGLSMLPFIEDIAHVIPNVQTSNMRLAFYVGYPTAVPLDRRPWYYLATKGMNNYPSRVVLAEIIELPRHLYTCCSHITTKDQTTPGLQRISHTETL